VGGGFLPKGEGFKPGKWKNIFSKPNLSQK